LPTSSAQSVSGQGKPVGGQPVAPAPSPLEALRASAAEDASGEESAKKVPFYKREISFGGKKKKQQAPLPQAIEAVAPAAVSEVASAELAQATPTAPVAKPEAKVPFYKREISFGGKKKKAPAAKAIEAAVPPVTAEVASAEASAAIPAAPVAAPVAMPEAKVPFYKRDISFGGKKKKEKAPVAKPSAAAAGADVPAAMPPAPVAAPVAAPEKKVPFYKRDISFGGKKKAPAAMPPTPVATPVAAPEKKVPFYKRDISFGGKKKAPAAKAAEAAAPVVAAEDAGTAVAPVAPAAAPEKKVPFYKRDLSLGHKPASAAPPKGSALRQKALVGVKIGASGISAARVVRNGSKLELLDLVREPLQRGVVVAGEVRDAPALAAALAHLFNTHGLPKKAVRLGISNNRIGVRIIEVSGVMDAKQLENAIRFRAQEVLPIALEDAVLDYQQLSESVNADGELVRRVLLVVAYRDLIDRYVVAFKEAGVRLVGIDLEAFGLLRALIPNGSGERSDAAHVVVSIGHERSTFAVSDGHVCEFTRVLEWGGSTLDVAIARQLNLAPSEAEPVKHSLTLDGSERPLLPGVTQEQVTTAADIVRRQLQTFARELVSSLQYYQNQPDSLGIGDIVITGGTSLLPGLASELQRLIGVSVRVGDPFERVTPSKGVVVDESQRALAAVVGLAIED
jgi:type IV pilus assembly protein PilM